MLAVYTGTRVNTLSPVAANDDVSSSDATSSVTFAASAGTTYMIAVDGFWTSWSGAIAQSAISLSWR